MATLCEWRHAFGKRDAVPTKKRSRKKKESRNLLERFWASVRLESGEECGSPEHLVFRTNDYGSPIAEHRGLEIFEKRGALPTIDLGRLRTTSSDNSPIAIDRVDSPLQITVSETTEPYKALDLFEPISPKKVTSPIAGVLAASPGPLSSRNCPSPPKLSIPEHTVPGPETARTQSPATAILHMASKFLDNIVKLAGSRSATPCTTVTIIKDGEIRIIDSEVFVNVIEDGKRSGIWDRSELQESYLEKLDIPSFTALGLPSANCDMQSPWMIEGPAGCAQELDALSRISRERQLLNHHLAGWR